VRCAARALQLLQSAHRDGARAVRHLAKVRRALAVLFAQHRLLRQQLGEHCRLVEALVAASEPRARGLLNRAVGRDRLREQRLHVVPAYMRNTDDGPAQAAAQLGAAHVMQHSANIRSPRRTQVLHLKTTHARFVWRKQTDDGVGEAHRSLSLLRVTVQEGPRKRAPRRRPKHSSGSASFALAFVRSASRNGSDATDVPGMRRPCSAQQRD
jgi:hypothetical protein